MLVDPGEGKALVGIALKSDMIAICRDFELDEDRSCSPSLQNMPHDNVRFPCTTESRTSCAPFQESACEANCMAAFRFDRRSTCIMPSSDHASNKRIL